MNIDMYFEEQSLPELHQMKHRFDDTNFYVDYGNKILDKSLSPYIYTNDRMFEFLTRLNRLVSILFDNYNIVKNFKNYTVDKYYYKHTR